MSYNAFERWQRQASARPILSIVIPTYNEAERILPTIAAIAVSVSSITSDWELIISDDGSKDGTTTMVRELGWANLFVIHHANTGKGGAVKRGMLVAHGDLVLFADADNSTPIEELPRLIAEIQSGASIAIGSRAAQGALEQNRGVLRQFVSDGLRHLTRQVTGLHTRDTQCGFKLFRHRVAQELFGLQRIDGFAFDLEILYLARKFKHPVSEVGVTWFDAPGSKVDVVRDGLRFVRDLLVILGNDAGGQYRKLQFRKYVSQKGARHAFNHRHQLSTESSQSLRVR
jgi:glycosyltransferase involved in cell wall biosynthesis